MEKIKYNIELEGLSMADESEQIDEIEEFILNADEEESISITRDKKDKNSQDIGTIIVAILGSSAITAVATGISKYINKRKNSVYIKTPTKTIKIDSPHVVEIVEALRGIRII